MTKGRPKGSKNIKGWQPEMFLTKDQYARCKSEAKHLYPKGDYVGREKDREIMIEAFLVRCNRCAYEARPVVAQPYHSF